MANDNNRKKTPKRPKIKSQRNKNRNEYIVISQRVIRKVDDISGELNETTTTTTKMHHKNRPKHTPTREVIVGAQELSSPQLCAF